MIDRHLSWRAWIVLAALAALPPAGRSAERVDRALFVPLRIVILKVEARLDDGRLQVGTGVTVAPGVVLTNCHVVENAEAISVSKRAGRWNAVAQHAVGRQDLCYLKVPGWRGPAIEFTDSPRPSLHQTTAAIGYTGGVDISFSEGEISAVHPYERSWLLQTTSVFTSGASGGALLDDRAQLMGILTFRLPGRRDHYYAVPADWVRASMPRDADWRPIGTTIVDRPFWQGKPETLPFFMQVPLLEAQQRWKALLDLSMAWESAEPKSAEPLLSKARALTQLDRHDEAIDSLVQATNVDPESPPALYQLGLALRASGRRAELDAVLARLRPLDESLADELKTPE